MTKCTAEGSVPSVNAKNQMNGSAYDAAGNLLTGGYTYDSENRLIASPGLTYDYDPQGQRIEKSDGTLYSYDINGNVLEETDLNGNLKAEYIFFGGKRIARRDPNGAVHYYFADHLGSTDIVTNASGVVEEEREFYPYGGDRIITDTGIGNNYKFTGKERDPETGLDEFGARYYSSALGRFTIPDWAAKPTAVPYANFGNPQSLNLYSYVQNNPTTDGDADGHGDYYSSTGKKLGSDGINDSYVHVAVGPVEKAPDGTISVAGTHTMYDISPTIGNAIQASVDRSNSPSGADMTGGFHEEGFSVDQTSSGQVVHVAPAGPGFRPTDAEASVRITTNEHTILEEHVHPTGTTSQNTIGGTFFQQTPSTVDTNNAAQNPNVVHVVAGAGDKNVRFYNGNGVQATVPLSAFPRADNKKNKKDNVPTPASGKSEVHHDD